MITFKKYYNTVKTIENILENVKEFDDFFEKLNENGIDAEGVMSSDMADMTIPLIRLTRNLPTTLTEVAPPSKKAEDFIQKNKKAFKERYGKDDWERILYATAWALHDRHWKKEN